MGAGCGRDFEFTHFMALIHRATSSLITEEHLTRAFDVLDEDGSGDINTCACALYKQPAAG